MPSSYRKPPLHPDRDELDVEAYHLPRWDADGNLVEQRVRQKPAVTEDIEEESVRPPTAEEIRRIHEDAYNDGFESGYEQGMRQGRQDGQHEGHREGYDQGESAGREAGEQAGFEAARETEDTRIGEHLAPLAEVLEGLKAMLPEQEAALQDGLVALAVRISRNLLDAELSLKPEHIEALVHAAVQALPNADERLTIELHPDDRALVERVADSHWTLKDNAQLSRGGCLVRTRYSYIDYSLEHRFRQQVSNLLARAGLSERLAEFEAPWPLPPAGEAVASEADAETAGDVAVEHDPGKTADPAGPAADNADHDPAPAGTEETAPPAEGPGAEGPAGTPPEQEADTDAGADAGDDPDPDPDPDPGGDNDDTR